VNDVALHDYLTVGFRADPTSASSYVRRLLAPGTGATRHPIDLLCQIIEEATVKQGRSEVVLPLTAGYDSRGLLGAALRVLPATCIRCITFGSETFRDVVVAAETCARLGLEHQRIDPNTIQWDLDCLTSSGRARWDRWKSLAPIDGIAVYDALASAADGCIVLSGYLGDAVSGAHLPHEEHARCGSGAAQAFLVMNRTSQLADVFGQDRLVTAFEEFIDGHRDLLASWRGLTPFDVLDLGFRQGGRIRAAACGAFRECITPYEDARWLRHWLTLAVSDRVGQEAYRRLYRTGFKAVFRDVPASGGEPPRRSAVARIRARVPTRLKRPMPTSLKRALRPRRPPPRPIDLTGVGIIHGRGDPRRNATMAKVLQETVTAFDRRQIVTELSASTAFRNLMEHPTRDDFFTVKWAASTEMYLRAGVFHAP
jgi:hypothetical protein